MKTFLKTELAYLAGFVDGEGCIGIYHRGDRNVYETKITVAQTEESILKHYRELFGGFVRLQRRPNTKWHVKPLWIWVLTGTTGARMLRLILPYMKVKKEHAELFLEMNRRKRSMRTCKGRPMGAQEVFFRDEIMAKLRALNKRGA